MHDVVDPPHRPGRERGTTVATGATQVPVQPIDVGRGQLRSGTLPNVGRMYNSTKNWVVRTVEGDRS